MEWFVFFTIITALIVLDLGIFNKKDEIISPQKSVKLTIAYLIIGLVFGIYIYFDLGKESAAEYYTGFLIEKTLSLDNIFLISVIFSALSIPQKYQHKVLLLGIIGVIILRGILIYIGAKVVEEFEWIMYIFAIILIVTGIKMLILGNKPFNIKESKLLLFLQKFLPLTNNIHGNKFYIYENDSQKTKIVFTPLFLSLVMIELCDLIFAIDSIPAIFSITTNSFVIYTSNVFAILGLRALYFAIIYLVDRFKYLKTSLSFILIFIGSKTFLKDILDIEKFPPVFSLSITIFILLAGVVFSILKNKKTII